MKRGNDKAESAGTNDMIKNLLGNSSAGQQAVGILDMIDSFSSNGYVKKAQTAYHYFNVAQSMVRDLITYTVAVLLADSMFKAIKDF